MPPNGNGPTRRPNGRHDVIVRWVLGIVATAVIAVVGASLTTWAQVGKNTEAVKECKQDLKEHCDSQKNLDGDVRVINTRLKTIEAEQKKQGGKLDSILEEVRRR